MGKRGPIPKNKALKIQTGTLPITAENARQLTEHFESPKPPRHFGKEERSIWRVTVKMLEPTRILEKIDQAILAAYCDAYAKWQKTEKVLQAVEKEHGVKASLLTMGANGNLVTNPLITISRKAQSDMVGYATQMGMTPAARIRIKIVPAKPTANPFERLKHKDNGKTVDADSD